MSTIAVKKPFKILDFPTEIMLEIASHLSFRHFTRLKLALCLPFPYTGTKYKKINEELWLLLSKPSHPEILKIALNISQHSCYDPQFPDLFSLAIKRLYYPLVKQMAPHVNINAGTKHQQTLLMTTDAKMVALLLSLGANPNAGGILPDLTPLHQSVSIDVVNLLIKYGGDVNRLTTGGDSPLHFCQSLDIAKALVTAGGNVNAVNSSGQTPLFNSTMEVIQYLISVGANVNHRDNTGRTCLYYYKTVKNEKEIADVIAKAGGVL